VGVTARNWWRKLERPIRGIVQKAIRLRYFLKHKLKDPEERKRRRPEENR
jgi:hypothetical protein